VAVDRSTVLAILSDRPAGETFPSNSFIERLNNIRREVQDLAEAAKQEYGSEDPYPGKW